MKIEWVLINGYDGNPVYHFFEIDDEKIKECATLEEAAELIERETDYNFMDNVDWNFGDPQRTADELKKVFEMR